MHPTFLTNAVPKTAYTSLWLWWKHLWEACTRVHKRQVHFAAQSADSSLPFKPPSHTQVPLLLGTTILKGFQGWRHKRRMKRRVTDPNLAQNRKEVTLEWDSLECTLTDKQGRQRILLDNLQGSARPGRWV